MVAAFFQVHDDIEQRNLVSTTFGVEGLKVFGQNKLVVLPANRTYKHLTCDLPDVSIRLLPRDSLLHGAELHSDYELRFGGHVLEDVGLQPPEHVRAQHVMQLLDLILLSNVGKLLQEDLQVTAQRQKSISLNQDLPKFDW